MQIHPPRRTGLYPHNHPTQKHKEPSRDLKLLLS